MGEIRISFRYNEKTGEKDIVVDFESDSDLMRHEHEKKHRQFIGQLIPDGEGVEIERISPGSIARPDTNEEQISDQIQNPS